MKIIKVLLMGLVLLIGAYVVLCILGPKSLNMERSIVVNAPSEDVYAIVSDFNRWKEWSPWQKRDPNMTNTVSGTPAAVGHKMVWISEQEGSGEQEITAVVPNERVTHALRFKDWDGESKTEFKLSSEGSSTKVSWSMEGDDTPFVFRGLLLIMGGTEMMNKDFDEGLSNIKSISER